jgi:hypothetical protein
MLRNQQFWHAASYTYRKVPYRDVESSFNSLTMQARSKLSYETITNVDGVRHEDNRALLPAGSNGQAPASDIPPGDYIVVVLVVATIALAFGLFWLVWILGTLLYEGGTALARTALYYQMTPPPGADGGLANAIAGSLAMVTAGTVLGTPIGVLAGTYLAEYGRRGWLAGATRFLNDVLLSAPSIVTVAFIAFETRGRMTDFRNPSLVPTK